MSVMVCALFALECELTYTYKSGIVREIKRCTKEESDRDGESDASFMSPIHSQTKINRRAGTHRIGKCVLGQKE